MENNDRKKKLETVKEKSPTVAAVVMIAATVVDGCGSVKRIKDQEKEEEEVAGMNTATNTTATTTSYSYIVTIVII